MDNESKIYRKLFASSFYISIFIVGGGYIAIPLLQKRFVDELGWIQPDEMTDLVSIAQSAPGAVAVNSSISVGYKIAGIKGAVCSLVGTVLPPLILITIIQKCYEVLISNVYISSFFKGMNCAIAAIMIDMIITMGKESFNSLKYFSLSFMIITFILVYLLNITPAIIVISCMFMGLIISYIRKKKEI